MLICERTCLSFVTVGRTSGCMFVVRRNIVVFIHNFSHSGIEIGLLIAVEHLFSLLHLNFCYYLR